MLCLHSSACTWTLWSWPSEWPLVVPTHPLIASGVLQQVPTQRAFRHWLQGTLSAHQRPQPIGCLVSPRRTLCLVAGLVAGQGKAGQTAIRQNQIMTTETRQYQSPGRPCCSSPSRKPLLLRRVQLSTCVGEVSAVLEGSSER